MSVCRALFFLAAAACDHGFGLVSVGPGGAFHEDGWPTHFAGTNALSLAQFSDAFERNDLLSRIALANMTLLRLWPSPTAEIVHPRLLKTTFSAGTPPRRVSS